MFDTDVTCSVNRFVPAFIFAGLGLCQAPRGTAEVGEVTDHAGCGPGGVPELTSLESCVSTGDVGWDRNSYF